MRHRYWSSKTEEQVIFVADNNELEQVYDTLVKQLEGPRKTAEAKWDDYRESGWVGPKPDTRFSTLDYVRHHYRKKRHAVIELWKGSGSWQYGIAPYKRITIMKKTGLPSGTARRMALLHDTLPTSYTVRNGEIVPVVE
jgi:hypothetical protein